MSHWSDNYPCSR